MLKYLLVLIVNLGLPTSLFAFDQSHALWSQVLQKYRTEQGLVRYAQLKKDAKDPKHHLNIYLADLQKPTRKEYEAWSKFEKMAFLINAYNAFTVKLIVDRYPIDSITDIGGMLWWFNKRPWRLRLFKMLDGKLRRLDSIENKYLHSKEFADYRIHAALNCASISCPVLRADAYVEDKLDKQLDDQMRIWMADKSKNRFDKKSKTLYVSKVFDWYDDDFDDWGGGIRKVVKKYAPKGAGSAWILKAKIRYLDYDWSLNGVKE
ncbi:MAG: DUF547 domain-containing protein [Deltaproteobacteria bacterium]|nr:DUF547 domain-containing protein [Deltaproteobacteria bacterium]